MTASPPVSNPLAADLDHILQASEGLWEPLRGKNIFVTGGTGFFGRWLLESFAHVNVRLNLGARMVVLSRRPDLFASRAPHLHQDPAIMFAQGDVRAFSALQVRTQLGPNAPLHYEFVIHAATEASAKLNAENPLLMIDTIVEGTRATLDFAVETGAKRFLLTSSGAVYGRQPSDVTHLPENYAGGPDPLQTHSAYGEAKRMAELLCATYHQKQGLEPLIARCFAFVGPFLPLHVHFAIGNFIRDAISGAVIRVTGDGSPYRSYLYAADLSLWLWTILFQGKASRAYNVGSEDARTILEIAEMVAAVCGGREIYVEDKPDPARLPARYVPSCQRAAEELELRPLIGLAEGIKRTVAAIPGKDRSEP